MLKLETNLDVRGYTPPEPTPSAAPMSISFLRACVRNIYTDELPPLKTIHLLALLTYLFEYCTIGVISS